MYVFGSGRLDGKMGDIYVLIVHLEPQPTYHHTLL